MDGTLTDPHSHGGVHWVFLMAMGSNSGGRGLTLRGIFPLHAFDLPWLVAGLPGPRGTGWTVTPVVPLGAREIRSLLPIVFPLGSSTKETRMGPSLPRVKVGGSDWCDPFTGSEKLEGNPFPTLVVFRHVLRHNCGACTPSETLLHLLLVSSSVRRLDTSNRKIRQSRKRKWTSCSVVLAFPS